MKTKPTKPVALLAALLFTLCTVGSSCALDPHWETPPNIKPGSERPANQALNTLTEMLAAFESGEIAGTAKIEASIEPSMIGLTLLLRAIQDAHAHQQSIRIHLADINIKANNDSVIITCRWEKRFLTQDARAASHVVPHLVKGDATFIFKLGGKQWKLSGISSPNPFNSGL